ncbi:MAG: hypothetical protein CMJ83_15010 [Planctomycetes bacterium]|nr:hypothetical protein [Planctomycetota bacterium]
MCRSDLTKWAFAALPFVLVAMPLAAQHRARCQLGQKVIHEGQTTIYDITIRNVKDVTVVEDPVVEGLVFKKIDQRVGRTSLTIINGQRTLVTNYRLRWSVTSEKTGVFRIAMPKLKAGDDAVIGHTVSLTVRTEDKQDQARIELSASATEVVIGESVGLTVDVYLKHLPTPAPTGDPLHFHDRGFMPQMRAPEVWMAWIRKPPFGGRRFDRLAWARGVMSRGKGFRLAGVEANERFAGEVSDVERPDASGKRAKYRRYRFYCELRADEVGTFEIPRAILQGSIAKLSGGKFRQANLFTRSGPVTVKVAEAPASGRPDAFAGAVGHFDLEVNPPTPAQVAVGDSVYVTVVISGRGFLDGVMVDLASQLGDAWRVEKPQITDSPKPGEKGPPGASKRPGTWRQFTYKIRPQNESIREVPAISFAYWDATDRRYVTKTSRTHPLVVHAAGTAIGDAGVHDATNGGRTTDELVAAGLSANEDDLNRLGNEKPNPFLFAGFLIALLPLWFGLSTWVGRRRVLAADPSLLRRKKAAPRARQRLSAARGRLEEDARAAVEAGAAAMCGLVADLDDRAEEATTSGDVLQWAERSAGADAATLEALRKLLDAGEAASFGGVSLRGSELRGVFDAADSLAASKPGAVTVRLLVPFLLCTAVALPAPAQDADVFQRAQAAFKDGRFDEAADLYESLLSDDYENGWVFYNLGNAHLKAGRVGHAIASYRRAGYYLPGDANLERNLDLALDWRRQALSADDGGVIDKILFWRRATTFSTQATLALIAAVLAFATAWLRLLRPRRWPFLRWTTWISLAFVLLFATSATLTWLDQTAGDHGVITANDTVLRKWPAEDADRSYEDPVHDGAELRVLQRKDGWLEVRVADRYVGWLPVSRAVTW